MFALRLNQHAYPIHSLTGTESLHTPFRFDITLFEFQAPHSLLLQHAELILPKRKITGIITQEIYTDGYITLTLQPAFSLLENNFESKLFLSETLENILKIISPQSKIYYTHKNSVPIIHDIIFQPPLESDACFLKRIFSHSPEKAIFSFDGTELFTNINNSNFTYQKQMLKNNVLSYISKTDNSQYKSGDIINNHYLIIKIMHEIKQAGIYANTITTQPVTADFNWPPMPHPALPITLTGYIRDQHCYIDTPLNINYKKSIPVNKIHTISFYQHADFPLLENSQVLISFIDGNPNKPIIAGKMYDNYSRINPVTEKNAHQHILKTKGLHQLIFDDNPQDLSILLQNGKTNQQLLLNKNLSLVAPKGNIYFKAKKTIVYKIQNNLHETTQKNYVRMIQKDYNNQTGDDLIYTAQQQCFTANQNFYVTAQAHLEMAADVNTESPCLNIHADKNNCLLDAGCHSIDIIQGDTHIAITSAGVITLTAPQIIMAGQTNFSVKAI